MMLILIKSRELFKVFSLHEISAVTLHSYCRYCRYCGAATREMMGGTRRANIWPFF